MDLAGHGREPFGMGRAGDRPDTRRLGAAARGQLGHGRQQETAQELYATSTNQPDAFASMVGRAGEASTWNRYLQKYFR